MYLHRNSDVSQPLLSKTIFLLRPHISHQTCSENSCFAACCVITRNLCSLPPSPWNIAGYQSVAAEVLHGRVFYMGQHVDGLRSKDPFCLGELSKALHHSALSNYIASKVLWVSFILVRAKCMRCPWALQRERSVCYFWNYFPFFFLGHILFSWKGLS